MKITAYLALVGAASAFTPMTEADHEFLKFVAEHGKSYGTKEEFEFRAALFKEAYDLVEEHNAQNSSYTLGINEFADWTSAQKKKRNGFIHRPKEITSVFQASTSNAPSSIDWRELGAVTDVRNQQQCGSCWTFSAAGALEGLQHITTKKLHMLSEQQLVDCDYIKDVCEGCYGGDMGEAFKYTAANGIVTENKYKYVARNGKCKTSLIKDPDFQNKGHTYVKKNDVESLKAAVAQQPVSVAIDGDADSLQMYRKGIYNDPDCGTELNHGVLIVGYGTGYWIVKNSWGPAWGEEGYVRMAIVDGDGICGINKEAVFPTL